MRLAFASMRDAIQIAGIHDLEEAELVLSCGVGFLGFPLRLSDGREDLTEECARDVVSAVGDRAQCVAITYLAQADEIAELTDFLGVRWAQLHGPVDTAQIARLRTLRPGLALIKSLVVQGNDAAPLKQEVARVGEHVDAFITDTYDPVTGRRGATGKIHDWRVSRELVAFSPKPVILAGGLNADNVAAAIRTVRPAAVDSHTGVEDAEGRKDAARMHAFVRAARSAFRAVAGNVDA